MGVRSCIDALSKYIENYSDKTEAGCNTTLLVKTNVVRKTIKEKNNLISELDKTLGNLDKEKRSI